MAQVAETSDARRLASRDASPDEVVDVQPGDQRQADPEALAVVPRVQAASVIADQDPQLVGGDGRGDVEPPGLAVLGRRGRPRW